MFYTKKVVNSAEYVSVNCMNLEILAGFLSVSCYIYSIQILYLPASNNISLLTSNEVPNKVQNICLKHMCSVCSFYIYRVMFGTSIQE